MLRVILMCLHVNNLYAFSPVVCLLPVLFLRLKHQTSRGEREGSFCPYSPKNQGIVGTVVVVHTFPPVCRASILLERCMNVVC
jgi:hypothetical protein